MGHSTYYVTVLFLRQPDDFWVAQALEIDLAAQGSSLENAKRAFELTFVGQLELDRRMGRQPLAHLKPAPAQFWDVWERMLRQPDRPQFTTEPISDVDLPNGIPPAFMVQAFPDSVLHTGR